MALDRHADRPIYKQLADELRARIETGDLGPGDELPSRAALAATYGVGLDTAGEALAILRTEGLIVTERGKAAYVAEPVLVTVTLDPGDQIEVRGGTLLVSRANGTTESYPSGQVRVIVPE